MEQPQPSGAGVDYPPAPWHMAGQQWLTLFRLSQPVDERRPAGLYAAAWVSYAEPSPLTYRELLVARSVDPRTVSGRRAMITDIWVDSPASMAGGRELWAIPKELCDFAFETSRTGPASRTRWSASAGGPIASARFTDVSRLAVRLPFRAGTWQPPIDGGSEPRSAELRGSGRVLPCRGRWRLARGGPLGWLADARPLASFRVLDFRMSFG